MEVDTSLILWTNNLKQPSSKLSLLTDYRFESLRLEITEMYVNESQKYIKKY